MYGEVLPTRQLEHDDLYEVACPIRADQQDPAWAGLCSHVESHLRVLDRMPDVLTGNPVPVGRAVDLQCFLVYYINAAWGRGARHATLGGSLAPSGFADSISRFG